MRGVGVGGCEGEVGKKNKDRQRKELCLDSLWRKCACIEQVRLSSILDIRSWA